MVGGKVSSLFMPKQQIIAKKGFIKFDTVWKRPTILLCARFAQQIREEEEGAAAKSFSMKAVPQHSAK
jgi:hypothetical protein